MNIIHAEIDREMQENVDSTDDGNSITCVPDYDYDDEEIDDE